MRDSVKIVIASIVCLGIVGAAGVYVYFSRNKNENRNIETRINNETNALEWKYEGAGEGEWKVLMQLDSLKGSDGQTPDIVNENGVIGYFDEEGKLVPIISTNDLIGSQGKTGAQGAQGAQGDQGTQGIQGEKGEDGRTPEFRLNGDFVQWKYTDESNWKTLVALENLTGNRGADGRSVEIRNNGTDIVWRYANDQESPWHPIVQVEALKGEAGPIGERGPIGETGPAGEPGKNGREVNIQTIDNVVKWKYVDEDDSAWRPLIAMADITGVPGVTGVPGQNGQSVALRVNSEANEIQWKHENDANWTTLVSLSALKGAKGDTGEQGVSGVPGVPGKKLEVKKFNALPAVTEDPSDPSITAFPGREAMIMYRYEGEGENAWKELVKLKDIKGDAGKDAQLTDLTDLRVEKDVVVGQDTSVDPAIDIKEDQIQWKDASGNWQRLCALADLNVTVPTPETKEFYTSTGSDVAIDATKNYLVTMTISGENATDNLVYASVSCAGNNLSGTWLPQITDTSTDPATVYPYKNTVTTSFIVTGSDNLEFDTTNINGMSLNVTVSEI